MFSNLLVKKKILKLGEPSDKFDRNGTIKIYQFYSISF